MNLIERERCHRRSGCREVAGMHRVKRAPEQGNIHSTPPSAVRTTRRASEAPRTGAGLSGMTSGPS